MQQDNNPAIEDLRRRGFGGSLSGSNFSTIHGDLIRKNDLKKSKYARTHVQGLKQPMLQGNERNKFFDNIENKTDLLRLLIEYLKREDVSKTLRIPIIVNDKDSTRKISDDSQSIIFECNHEEADSRMVLHNCLEDTNVLVVSKDTDVLVLMVFVFVYHQPNKEWFMKIEADKYVNIGAIVKHFGDEFCLKHTHIHALTGCDTTSFFHGIGKVKASTAFRSIWRVY